MLFSTVLIVVREVLGAKGEERFPDLEKTAWKGGQPNPELGMESSASNIGAIRGGFVGIRVGRFSVRKFNMQGYVVD